MPKHGNGFSKLFESGEANEASSVRWSRKSAAHLVARVDGKAIVLNKFTAACRINGGDWIRLQPGSQSSLKAQAIRLAQRALHED